MATYLDAPDVQDIIGSLITTVQDHSRLANAEIRVVFRDQHAKSKGKIVYGKARKVTGLNAYLAKAADPLVGFFVIELAYDLWHRLEPHQQRALIDHELSHCYVGYDDDTGEEGVVDRRS